MSDLTNGSAQAELVALKQQVGELQQRLAVVEERERIMRQLLDNLPSALYATRRDGVIAVVNSAFAAQWGQRPADFEGRALTELFPPEVAAAWQQNIDQALAEPLVRSSQESYGEGEQARHYDNLRFPIAGETGDPIGIGGIATDITDRVRAEASYADTKLILEGIVNNSPAAIAVKSPEGRLILVNQTYASVVGQPLEELVGQSEDGLFPPELIAAWRQHTGQLFADGQPVRTADTLLVNANPHEFITVQFPLSNHEGQPYAICAISTDVSELKRAEQDRLQLQNDIIEAQQAALRELNTPLIPLAEDVVVMPLIGSIDSARAGQVLETLLEGVNQHRARIAIVDITGLPVVDTQVAGVLLRAANAVKLLGAEVLLTGIGPEVAQTLVGIGADLSGLKTPGTLQAGILYALRRSR